MQPPPHPAATVQEHAPIFNAKPLLKHLDRIVAKIEISPAAQSRLGATAAYRHATPASQDGQRPLLPNGRTSLQPSNDSVSGTCSRQAAVRVRYLSTARKSSQVTGKVRLGAPAKQFVKKESRRVEQDVRSEEVVELVRDGPEVLLARCRNPASPEERSSDQ